MRRRDAIVLLLICGFVLLNAGAMRLGGSMRAKVLMCRVNLREIGQAMTSYCDLYDGKLPPPAGNATGGVPSIRTPYEVCQDPDHDATTQNDVWMNLGCLYKAELVSSGMVLCCPANPDGSAEYDSFCWSGSLDESGNKVRVPWGTTYNWPTHTSAWWHVMIRKGYAFWPQAMHLLTQAEYNVIASRGENPSVRYVVGLPATPGRLADMDPDRAFSCDYQAVSIRGSGFIIQSVFSDGHVNIQPVPVDPVDGKFWYPYQGTYPQGELASNWKEIVPVVRYFYALQP